MELKKRFVLLGTLPAEAWMDSMVVFAPVGVGSVLGGSAGIKIAEILKGQTRVNP